MNNDTYQANLLSRNYRKEIEYKDHDSLIVSVMLGVIVAAMFLAIVLAIYAVKVMVVA